MNANLLQGFYLGDTLVEPLTGKVTGREGSAHLSPKAVEVLLCLASSPGALVTRDELIHEVWGDDHGSDESLNKAVVDIRHALHDDPDHRTFIQTLPRRGYRLAVEPEPIAKSSSSIVFGVSDGAKASDIGFLENLRQRGVLETAIAYVVVGWVLLQATDVIFEQLHLPAWVGTFLTVLIFAGFPIALALSWFIEIRQGNVVFDSVSPADRRRRRFGRTYVSVVGALALAGILVWIYDQYIGLPKPQAEPALVEHSEPEYLPPPVTENSIAVLPFMNIDGGGDTQIFANGLVDDVISHLSRVPGLLVSSRGDAFSLPPNSHSQDVRRRLRVAQYLEGSVQMAGDQLRVVVQLIDSETGFHILSRSFDRQIEDFFDIRDEITDLTVANVRVALPRGAHHPTAADTDDPSVDLYVLYRRGIEESRRPQTIETVETALRWFDAALAVDPDYAAAHAGKCSVYAGSYPLTNDPKTVNDAEAACNRAIALNPNLDVVHTALGDLYRLTGKYDEAETAYLAALDIYPGNVDAMRGLGKAYRDQQRLDESEQTFRKAIGLQPGNSHPYNDLGTLAYQRGHYEEAVKQYLIVVALNKENPRGYLNLGAAYMLDGDFAAAAPAYRRSLEIDPQPVAYSNLSLMHYYLGNTAEAIAAINESIALLPNDHLAWTNLGDILWGDGQEAAAMEAFAKAREFADIALSVNPNDASLLMDLAWINAMLGEDEQARTGIEHVMTLLPDDPYAYYYKGLVFDRLGDPDTALDALGQAADKGYPLALLFADPHLISLRKDSRFVATVGQRREDLPAVPD